jgi:hypothetical protein
MNAATSGSSSAPSRTHSITARLKGIADLAPDTRSPTPPPPQSVKIELTARCDFQCAFCASHTRPRTKSDMPWERYARLARELRRLGVEQLGVFYLGESFVCDWLAEAIRYAKRECGYPYVFLTTNGRLATAARVRECMLAGLDSLKFAVNAYGPEELAAVAGVDPEEFNVIIRNVQDARRVRDEIERESGHRCALYASSLLIDGLQKVRMAPALAEIAPYVDEHYWLPLFGRKPLPCWPLFKEGHITWDGRLSACCLDHAARFDMGNLDATPFLEAWHSPAFRALRQAHLRLDVRGTPCENCIEYI